VNPSDGWAELLKFGGQAAVVGFGWWLVNRQSIARERDKGRRELIAKSVDLLCDRLDDLFRTARDYHTAEARDIPAEVSLKMELQVLAFQVGQLALVAGSAEQVSPAELAIVRLRQSITGENFEDEREGSLTLASPQAQSIAAAVIELQQALQTLKHQQFSTRSMVGPGG
jgi:hypothetical protein